MAFLFNIKRRTCEQKTIHQRTSSTKARFCSLYTEATAPVDYLFGQIRDHQGECQICTANQEHHSQDLHPKGCPRNISFPISMEAAEPSQRNWKLQHVFDHAANQWPTTPSSQHPLKGTQSCLVSMP